MSLQHLVAWRDCQAEEQPAKHETTIFEPEVLNAARNDRLSEAETVAALVVKRAFASHPHWGQHVGKRSLRIDIMHPEAWMGSYVVPVLLNGDRPSTSAFRSGDIAARATEQVLAELKAETPGPTLTLVAAE